MSARSSRVIAAAGAFLALTLAGCGAGEDEAGGPTGEQIRISLTEFALDPATVELEGPGTYTFVAVNDGSTEHALEVEGHGIEDETENIAPGESAELTVELTEEGEYELYCPVGNHREMGMEGDLHVGAAHAGTGETGHTDTEDGETETEGGETETDDGY